MCLANVLQLISSLPSEHPTLNPLQCMKMHVSSKHTAVNFVAIIRTSPSDPIASEGGGDTLTIGTPKLSRTTTCMY